MNKYIHEFKTLIDKEKESNKTIKGQIIEIDGNDLEISINHYFNLSKNMSVEVNRVKATVTDVNNKIIRLHVSDTSIFSINQKVSIQNIQKEIIIRKLQEIHDNIVDNNISNENKKTLSVLFANEKSDYDEQSYIIHNLNENQKSAVMKSLQSDKFHLIQGPPGTGKTHTIIEIIKHLHKQNNKILITTHTHIALDNILERLNDIDENKILRLGEKTKISSQVLKYTMENHIKQHVFYSEIIQKNQLIEKLANANKKHISENIPPKEEENLISKFFRLIFHIKQKDYLYDTLSNDCQYDNSDTINELQLEIQNIKKYIQKDVLKNVRIIASTVIASSSYLTRDMDFDYVIMDEASQVPVYLSLIPLMKTTKFILIGDNKQLQPIHNYNASHTLNKSIFNLLIEKYPSNYTFLNIQYRMNQEISDIASKLYYDGKLMSGDNVKNQRIKLNDNKSFLLDEEALTVIDTSNVNYDESNSSGGCCNHFESDLILNLVYNLKRNGVSLDEIGVITPYRKQKVFVRKLLSKNCLDVECDTIYRFQGREKNVIIVSFCKSSNKSLTNFQKDFISNENQLNVSITRSRKKLILIGNLDMIRTAENIDSLFKMIPMDNFIYLQDVT